MLSITVIIATYNRSRDLAKVLKDLLAQERNDSFDYDVLVADNNSTDHTREAVESFIPSSDGKLRYIFEGRQGKSYALNKAIKEASGEIVAFTDDDVSLDPKWLMNLVKCFEQTQCDGCGGRILPVFPDDTPQWLKDNLDLLRGTIVYYDYGEETKKYEKSMFEFLGANYAFRREMFAECGDFRADLGTGRPPLGEDTEFVNRLEMRNKKLYYCGSALVWHPVDLRRAKLNFIAKWNVALGRYRAVTADNETVTSDLVYYFGVPRYLMREMLQNGLALVFHIFNKREFLKRWILLSLDWGRAIEFRRAYQSMILELDAKDRNAEHKN